ncbi:G2/mitotic-specific cyclin S13-7-like [Euphorbia lathyris]|uniref:G2/mitotic-specific cyclin S13-7-like n=1 Tax=Euphorbia lathyris TaxID=212925 RepID=UPI003313C421
MASRPIVPQQARGEAVAGGNMHQKKNVAAAGDGRNRRALGDIGNLVTVRGNDAKAQDRICRPMTRSFRAQLLANAQADVAAENHNLKKIACVKVNKVGGDVPVGVAVGKKHVAEKAIQKKVTVIPKPKEVIVISPDTEKDEKLNKPEEKKTTVELQRSSKKKAQTYTSALTARSKKACGIASKPKEDIVDIDAADANNDLAGIEYVEDIYRFYKAVENESRPHNYMESQPEINERMRAILIDWLVDVHQRFELSPETFYLTINIIDRFLCVKTVPRRELQLVGISATLIAAKYEEIWPPEVNDLVCISDRAYTHGQVLIMEKTILGKLEWTITVPTHFVFLARFIKASIPDKEMENMVYFLAELGIMHYDTIMFCPSMVAASAVYAARCTLKKSPVWTETLKVHTGFSESQLKDCAGLLAFFHTRAGENKLQSVNKKYSNPLRGSVAQLTPAKSLLPPSLSQ